MSTTPHVAKKSRPPKYVATRNACKLCTPLGACLALRGIEGALPFLHGSQGCATYMRRYIISHFKEPMDIAASGFSEASTIFGGEQNLHRGLQNVTSQYHPSLIGIATICLSETIGEDVKQLLHPYEAALDGADAPVLVPISTPSYCGTHIDGFHAAVRAVVEKLATPAELRGDHINLFPGMVSAADIRYLKEVAADFSLESVLLPDYSDTLDGPALDRYHKIPEGGTPIAAIRSSASASATVEFGRTIAGKVTAATFLRERFAVPSHRLGVPIGVRETDAFFEVLEQLSGRPTPAKHRHERGRLIDAYVDGHKYVSGNRAVVYGEEDLVVGLAALLAEIGVVPVLCASGGESGSLAKSIAEVTADVDGPIVAREGTDFMSMADEAKQLSADFLIGSSKGYSVARQLGIPLIRAGFPIHDRIGGQRILHLGYRGAQQLFDRIVNALIEFKQQSSPVGYSYM
jgi:nitrogenase molybdenum-iron protein NifN